MNPIQLSIHPLIDRLLCSLLFIPSNELVICAYLDSYKDDGFGLFC